MPLSVRNVVAEIAARALRYRMPRFVSVTFC